MTFLSQFPLENIVPLSLLQANSRLLSVLLISNRLISNNLPFINTAIQFFLYFMVTNFLLQSALSLLFLTMTQ